MRILNGIISLTSSFFMFILLYTLRLGDYSTYSAFWYIFPFILLAISICCFFKYYVDEKNNA